MAQTIQEIRQNVTNARSAIEQAKQENQEARQQAQQAKSNLTSQQSLRRTSGIRGLVERNKAISQVDAVESNISQREQDVRQYEQEVSNSERQLQTYDEKRKGVEIVERAIRRDNPMIALMSSNKYARDYYSKYLKDRKRGIEGTIKSIKEQVGNLDNSTTRKIQEEVRTNFGKVDEKKLTENVNTILASKVPAVSAPVVAPPVNVITGLNDKDDRNRFEKARDVVVNTYSNVRDKINSIPIVSNIFGTGERVAQTVYQSAETGTKELVSSAATGVKEASKTINDRVYFDITGTPTSPKLNIEFGKKPEVTRYDYARLGTQILIEDKRESINTNLAGKDNIQNLNNQLQAKYDSISQSAFENDYAQKIQKGELTFEQAKRQFESSDSYKSIVKEYQDEYAQKYNQLLRKSTSGFKYVQNFDSAAAQYGLNLAQTALAVTRTPLSTASTAVVAGGVVYGFGALPTIAQNTISTVYGIRGTTTFFNPNKDYVERTSGLVEAGISFGVLGKSALDKLNKPINYRNDIRQPVKNYVKTSEYTNFKSGDKVIYPVQQVSQTGSAGSYAVQTNVWRSKVNEVLGRLGSNYRVSNIYNGNPYAVTQYNVMSSGTEFTYSKVGVEYQRAFNILRSYGLTESQARAALRYQAPQIRNQVYRGEIIKNPQGDSAEGYFAITTERPVVQYSNSWIKTRGGKPVEDFVSVERNAITINGKPFALEQSSTLTSRIDGVKKLFTKFNMGEGIIYGSSTGLKQGVAPITQNANVLVPAQYKNTYTMSVRRNILPVEDKIDITLLKTRGYESLGQTDDAVRAIKPNPNVKKTPLSETFKNVEAPTAPILKDSNVKEIIKSDAFQNMISTIDEQTQSQSQFFGTGLYEKTDDIGQVSSALTSPYPVTPLKSPTIINPSIKVVEKNNIIGASSFGVSQPIRNPQLEEPVLNLNNNYKLDEGISDIVIDAQPVKPVQRVSQPSALVQPIALDQPVALDITSPSVEAPLQTPRPITPPVIKNNKGGEDFKPKRILSKVRKAFDVVTFKGGNPVTIAKKLPEGRAKKVGVKNVLSTARASFKLKESGTTSDEDINFNVPANLFRKGKNDDSLYVQKLNTRLSDIGEVKEVVKARRAKRSSKPVKFKWI